MLDPQVRGAAEAGTTQLTANKKASARVIWTTWQVSSYSRNWLPRTRPENGAFISAIGLCSVHVFVCGARRAVHVRVMCLGFGRCAGISGACARSPWATGHIGSLNHVQARFEGTTR